MVDPGRGQCGGSGLGRWWWGGWGQGGRGRSGHSGPGQAGRTPLLAAANNGHLPTVKVLAEEGKADVEAATSVRWTWCDMGGVGGLTDGRRRQRGWRALHWAVERNQEAVVRYLVGRGADTNARTDMENLGLAAGSTPLDASIQFGHDRITSALTAVQSVRHCHRRGMRRLTALFRMRCWQPAGVVMLKQCASWWNALTQT